MAGSHTTLQREPQVCIHDKAAVDISFVLGEPLTVAPVTQPLQPSPLLSSQSPTHQPEATAPSQPPPLTASASNYQQPPPPTVIEPVIFSPPRPVVAQTSQAMAGLSLVTAKPQNVSQ